MCFNVQTHIHPVHCRKETKNTNHFGVSSIHLQRVTSKIQNIFGYAVDTRQFPLHFDFLFHFICHIATHLNKMQLLFDASAAIFSLDCNHQLFASSSFTRGVSISIAFSISLSWCRITCVALARITVGFTCSLRFVEHWALCAA